MSRFLIALVGILAVESITFAQQPTGWRGDGSGVYPKADPPVAWQRVSKSVAALRTQADPPKGDDPSGQPMSDGVIRQWLILGPIAATKGEKGGLDDPMYAPDQSKLSPAPGQEAHGSKWQLLKTDTAYIDCAQLFGTYGQKPVQVAYAHAWIHAPADTPVIIRAMAIGTAQIWINGTLTNKPDQLLDYNPQPATLQKGWNRILLRITPPMKTEQTIVAPWFVNVVVQAKPDSAVYEQKNIAWRVALPSATTFGPPIVVNGRIYLESEPADLVCLDGATGKILWVRSNNYNDVATEEERKANPEIFKEIDAAATKLQTVNESFAAGSPPKAEPDQGGVTYKEKASLEKSLYALMKKVDGERYKMPGGQDVGYSGMCPASDGQRVYAWYATGVTCCYDLDGKLIWRRLDNEGSFFEHGYSTSPILADGKLIVTMNKLIAFDAAKGERVWTSEFDQAANSAKRSHGTPAAARIGDAVVCVLPTGQIVRLSDGKFVREKGPDVSNRQQEIPSPVAIGGTVYRLSTYGPLYQTTLPAAMADPLKLDAPRIAKIDTDKYPTYYLPWQMSSPLIHDGLAYCLNNTGVLSVVDTATMAVVYQKLLDIDHFQSHGEGAGRGVGASPAFAGGGGAGRIYLLGNSGTTIVIKPGRTYEQFAKNRIESVIPRNWANRHERFVAPPVFDGKRMYLRGERYLYCIAESSAQ